MTIRHAPRDMCKDCGFEHPRNVDCDAEPDWLMAEYSYRADIEDREERRFDDYDDGIIEDDDR